VGNTDMVAWGQVLKMQKPFSQTAMSISL